MKINTCGVNVLKRILWLVPTVFAVTIIGFILLANAPGDAVDGLVISPQFKEVVEKQQKTLINKSLLAQTIRLDLPLFYFFGM